MSIKEIKSQVKKTGRRKFMKTAAVTALGLTKNRISDIGPLVANEGIGEGDVVSIDDNELDCDDAQTEAHLAELRDRGVDVWDDCS